MLRIGILSLHVIFSNKNHTVSGFVITSVVHTVQSLKYSNMCFRNNQPKIVFNVQKRVRYCKRYKHPPAVDQL